MADPTHVKPAPGVSVVASTEIGVDWSLSANSVAEFPTDPKKAKYVRSQILRGKLVAATEEEYDDFTEANPPYTPPPSGNVGALADLSDVEVDDANPDDALVKGEDGIWRPKAIDVGGGGVLTTQTFNFTGGPQEFTVPSDVTEITMELWGAAGGGPNGGQGGHVVATRTVDADETLTIFVGGAGGSPDAGYNGGGAALGDGGGGGGASDVRIGAAGLGQRIVVAAGGGGSSASGNKGGDGGADIGERGLPALEEAEGGGAGGTQGAGGAARNSNSQPGSVGQGANASHSGMTGGGGGWYGGATGGEWFAARGGAGGGSNYANEEGDVSERGGRIGNGRVILTYTTSNV